MHPSPNLTFSSVIPPSPHLKKLLYISNYSLTCNVTLNFVDKPLNYFNISAEKSSIQHIAMPVGKFTVSPLIADSLTLFSGNITNWKMILV